MCKVAVPTIFHKGIVNAFKGEFWTFEVGLIGTDHISYPYYISAKDGETAAKALEEQIDTDFYEITDSKRIF